MVGTPNSRATEARWLVTLPMSVIIPLMLPHEAGVIGRGGPGHQDGIVRQRTGRVPLGQIDLADGNPGGSGFAPGEQERVLGEILGQRRRFGFNLNQPQGPTLQDKQPSLPVHGPLHVLGTLEVFFQFQAIPGQGQDRVIVQRR